MPDLSQLWVFIASGGLVGLITASGKAILDWRSSKVMREDSAVATWRGIADSRLAEIHDPRRELDWYRGSYALLWHSYERLPPAEKERFPAVPPPPSDPPPT